MITFSTFDNTRSREPSMASCEFAEFVEVLQGYFAIERPATAEEKEFRTLMVSPAIYGEGSTRKNENVEGFGSWFALDIDSGATIADIMDHMEVLRAPYALWTTTKSKASAERFRLAFPLDRDVEAEECRTLWEGAYEFFGRVSDIQTKDPARIFAMPASWQGSDPRFEYRLAGSPIIADRLLAAAPTPAPLPPQTVSSGDLSRIRRALAGKGKAMAFGHNITNSPVVTSRMVETYLALPRGDHHRGLFVFMTAVASMAIFKGIEVSPDDLADYARQLDNTSIVKTAKSRWGTINTEAAKALRWAQSNYRERSFTFNDL